MSADPEAVRAAVRRAYARALDGPATPYPRGEVNLPGYTWREASLVPSRVAAASLGCGNPLAAADPAEGEVVLDLGCGAGMDALIAARRVGPRGRVIGVDMTAEMVQQARLNTAGFENVLVLRALIEQLPLAGASVDCAIANGALGLSPEKGRVLGELYRVLRTGGRAVLCDVTPEPLPPSLARHPALRASCLPDAFTEEAYLEALRAAGFATAMVAERRACSANEVAAIVHGELRADAGQAAEAALAEVLFRALSGRVALVTLSARKPATLQAVSSPDLPV